MATSPPVGRSRIRPGWALMALGVVAESAIGFAVLVDVPTSRPNGWIPAGSRSLYLAHAVLGALLGAAALLLALEVRHDRRVFRTCSVVGVVAVGTAAVGGSFAAYHSVRAGGIALMLVGALVAFFAYCTGAGEGSPIPDGAPRPGGSPG